MRLILSFLTILISFSAFANTLSFKNIEGDNHIILHQEAGMWVVDHIVVPYGKLQELKSSKLFASKTNASSFINNNYSHYRNLKSLFVPNKTVTTESKKVIWDVENQWTLEWEDKFAKWITENMTSNFYFDNNIATDCADAAYLARWIFARIHKLPAAGTLAGSNIVFTQDSFKEEWSHLQTNEDWKKDELFLKAADYLTNHVYTATLVGDGYPIEINESIFNEGTVWLEDGHTYFVAEINRTDSEKSPIYMLNSTVPKEVRRLSSTAFMDSEGIEKEIGGFLHFRWPIKINDQWMLTNKSDMPFYSLEQYEDEFTEEFGSFAVTIINRIGISFKPRALLAGALESIVTLMNDRIQIVEDGFNYCSDKSCAFNSQDYEDWSTPSRDKRIFAKYKEAKKMAYDYEDYDEDLDDWWDELLDNTSITVKGNVIPLLKYMRLSEYDLISHHPKSSVAERWGFTDKDIISHLKNKFQRMKQLQTYKLDNVSSVCSDSEACSYEKDNWMKWSTYKSSQFFSELEKSINIYCRNNKSFCKLFKSDYNYTEFFNQFSDNKILLGNPLLPLNIRKAEHLQNYNIFEEVKTIFTVNDKYIIVNDRLFNLENKSYVDLGNIKRLDFLPKMNKIAAFGNNPKKFELKLLDPVTLAESTSFELLAEGNYRYYPNRSFYLGEDLILIECEFRIDPDRISNPNYGNNHCNIIALDLESDKILIRGRYEDFDHDGVVQTNSSTVGLKFDFKGEAQDVETILVSNDGVLKEIVFSVKDDEWVGIYYIIDNLLLYQKEIEFECEDLDDDQSSEANCEKISLNIRNLTTNQDVASINIDLEMRIYGFLNKNHIFLRDQDKNEYVIFKIQGDNIIPVIRNSYNFYIFSEDTFTLLLDTNDKNNFVKVTLDGIQKFNIGENENIVSHNKNKLILFKNGEYFETDFERTYKKIISNKFGVPKYCKSYMRDSYSILPVCISENDEILSFENELSLGSETYLLNNIMSSPTTGKPFPINDHLINVDGGNTNGYSSRRSDYWYSCHYEKDCFIDKRDSSYIIKQGSIIRVGKDNYLYLDKELK